MTEQPTQKPPRRNASRGCAGFDIPAFVVRISFGFRYSTFDIPAAVCVALLLTVAACRVSDAPPAAGREREPEPTTILPAYRCPRIDAEIALTGKLDDPRWARAPVIRLVEAATGAEPRQPTEVRLLCSPTRLYIGFRCADTHVWGTKAARDADIYNEECVEVFISPAGTAHQYYEINVSPLNVVFDACVLNRRLRPGMRAPYVGLPAHDVKGLETAVHIAGEPGRAGGATAWSAEYAIPLDSLIGAPNVPPSPGDRWRLNLYRIDAPEGAKREFSAWSPTRVIDFHLPEAFGTLTFD